jgi:16S rRNA (uracil1498-N3)-methyltransferase
MNLILLFPVDYVAHDVVRLRGRRFEHVVQTHRAKPGDRLVVGLAGEKIGRGEIVSIGDESVDLRVVLDSEPPPPLPVTLVLALPRPKVLNRVIAGATSMGVKQIFLINAWRVEKSYWSSPRLSDENLRFQAILGLEQAGDTILPSIAHRRLFRPFVEDELPSIARHTRALVAQPGSAVDCPRRVDEPVTLVIGPEGGFIEQEIASLERCGFLAVTLGDRVLRVETAVAAVLSRLF